MQGYRVLPRWVYGGGNVTRFPLNHARIMKKFLAYLKGKRTYITAFLGAVYAAAIGLELLPNVEFVWGLLGSSGLVFLRAGMQNQVPEKADGADDARLSNL